MTGHIILASTLLSGVIGALIAYCILNGKDKFYGKRRIITHCVLWGCFMAFVVVYYGLIVPDLKPYL